MSLCQASITEGGRDKALQQKGEEAETANLASSWAEAFASLLTQEKTKETKSKAKLLISKQITLISQGAFKFEPLIASIQQRESLSTMMFEKHSSFARVSAHLIAAASEVVGSTERYLLD